ATLAFASPAVAGPVLDLNDADLMKVSGLTLSGGQYGAWVRNGSVDLELTNVTATGAALDGVRVEANSTGSDLVGVRALANNRYGVIFAGTFDRLVNGTISFNRSDGVYLGAPGPGRLEGNTIQANQGYGVESYGGVVIGSTDLAAGKGNFITGNARDGIYVFA